MLAAVVLLGVNLRTAVASLPPLLDEVRGDLGLSGTAAGVLHDLSGGWTATLAFILAISVAQLLPGVPAARDRTV